jgi:predicted dehydrogenase
VAVTQWLFRDLDYYRGWKGDPVAAGGGCLINQAIHALDLALAVTGIEPTRIRCRTRTLRAIHVEDSATATLEDDSGRFIDLAAATCTPLIEPQLLRVFFPDTTVLILGTETPHAAAVQTQDQAAQALAALAVLPDDYGDGHASLVDDVVIALREGVPSRYGCELRDTITTHEAVFAMYNSARDGGAEVFPGGAT